MSGEITVVDPVVVDAEATPAGEVDQSLVRIEVVPEVVAFHHLIQMACAISYPLAVYHGYRRNGTLTSAALWGLAANTRLWPAVIAVALAQGFGKKA